MYIKQVFYVVKSFHLLCALMKEDNHSAKNGIKNLKIFWKHLDRKKWDL